MSAGRDEPPAEAAPGGSRGRVVVGVDGSAGSLQALQMAVEEARYRGATLHAVLAWHVPEYYYGTPTGMVPPPPPTLAEDAALEAKERLARILKRVPGDTQVVAQVIEDHPAKALVQAAEGADMLVVGSRGRGGFSGLLLGSVSQACAHHSPCPVLIVPPGQAEGRRPTPR